MSPLLLKMKNAIEYTRTQLIKFGSVVSVCVNLLKYLFPISMSRIANAIGSHENAIPSPLIANVFPSTSTMSARLEAFEKRSTNQRTPTKSQSSSLKGGL